MAGYVMAFAVGAVVEYYALTRWFPALRAAVVAWWRRTVSAVVLQGLKTLPEDARSQVFRRSVNPPADEAVTGTIRTIGSAEPESVNPFAD